MRVLALDIGEKRVGVAVGDTRTHISMPVKVMPTNEVTDNARTWRMLLEDHEPELLVSGLPRSMNGAQDKQANWVRSVAQKIASTAGLPLEFTDERLSSVEAKRVLREQGLKEKDMRGKIDMVAASLFLQTWLDNYDGE